MACGARRPQAALIRVRVHDGELVTGPGHGRSAYVCAAPACAERALARRLLARRLRVPDASDAVLRRSFERGSLAGPTATGC